MKAVTPNCSKTDEINDDEKLTLRETVSSIAMGRDYGTVVLVKANVSKVDVVLVTEHW